jgi:hypothetical protein
MKKLIFLFAASILSLTSCTKDDDKDSNNDSNSNKLPKSEVTTVEPDGTVSIVNYTFDGTKISTTSTSNKNKRVYIYTADVLSKIEDKVNDITVSYTEYLYEKGDIKSTTTYTVAADKSVTKTSSTSYTYDEAKKTQTVQDTYYIKGAPTVSKTSTVNTYDDKNLSKSVTTTIVDDKNDTTTIIDYVYDTKSNYWANITGQPATIAKSTNNIVTINTKVVVRTDNVIGTPVTTQETFEYAYSGSFPSDVKNYTGGKLSNTKNVYYN